MPAPHFFREPTVAVWQRQGSVSSTPYQLPIITAATLFAEVAGPRKLKTDKFYMKRISFLSPTALPALFAAASSSFSRVSIPERRATTDRSVQPTRDGQSTTTTKEPVISATTLLLTIRHHPVLSVICQAASVSHLYYLLSGAEIITNNQQKQPVIITAGF